VKTEVEHTIFATAAMFV